MLQGTLEGIGGLEFLFILNMASNQLVGDLKYLLNKVKLVRNCGPSHTRKPNLFLLYIFDDLHNWLTVSILPR